MFINFAWQHMHGSMCMTEYVCKCKYTNTYCRVMRCKIFFTENFTFQNLSEKICTGNFVSITFMVRDIFSNAFIYDKKSKARHACQGNVPPCQVYIPAPSLMTLTSLIHFCAKYCRGDLGQPLPSCKH